MELKAWVDGEELPSNHPGHRVHAYPATETHPTLWILGSSDYGAQLAAHLGLNYAFAHFITDGAGTKEALNLYRNNFKPNGENQKALQHRLRLGSGRRNGRRSLDPI